MFPKLYNLAGAHLKQEHINFLRNCNLPKIKLQKIQINNNRYHVGNYVQITHFSGNTIYEGIINSINKNPNSKDTFLKLKQVERTSFSNNGNNKAFGGKKLKSITFNVNKNLRSHEHYITNNF